MNDDNYGDSFEARRDRRNHLARENAPRATRSTRYKKKRSSTPNVGGAHKRRNKHWSW